jgi:hypothetical protein
MKSWTVMLIIVIIAFAVLSAPSQLAAQNQGSAVGAASCYSALLSGPSATLSAYVQSMNSNGTVVVNGVDTAQPDTPFQFSWGDGASTSGFFTQQHVYSNASQNYVITVTATENSGTTQQFSFPVFFTAPTIAEQSLPGISFQIPSQPVTLQTHYNYPLPTGVTDFSNSSFPTYSRSDEAYILASASAIDYNFANNNSFLSNGVFSIDMLENSTYSGGLSVWWTTPMSVGYGPTILNAPIQWYILFNEIGKDTTLNTPITFPYGGNTDGDASEIYSETMGDIFSYASACQLVSNAASYGIGSDVALDIRNSMLSGAAALQGTFNAYISTGAPFSSWNPNNGEPDPTLGTISALSWKFIEHAEMQGQGYRVPTQRMMKFLQMFNASMLASYAPASNTSAAATFRSTLMVAALSYAFSQDLRSEFTGLNFPIDNETFEQLYEMATGGGASLSPSTYAFAAQDIGSASAGQTFTLTNYLLEPINLVASFSGVNPKDFPVQASSTCPYPAGALAANSSCTYVISFAPSLNGTETSTFSVADIPQDVTQPLANSPQVINLSGTGANPKASLSATSISFLAQKVGTTSAAKSVTLTNTGTSTLSISTVSITSDFALAKGTTCVNGGTVAPGAKCVINVTLTPANKGTLTGSATMTDNALASPQAIALSGTGN